MRAGTRRGIGGTAVLAAISGGLLVLGSRPIGDDWRPVEEAIDLTQPGVLEVSFQARPGADYHFGVEVDPSPTSSCLLRIRRSSRAPACAVENPLDVEWRVESDGRLVVSGSMDDWPGSSWGGGSGEAAMLADIPADPAGPEYQIRVLVRSAAPDLTGLQPRFVVGIGGGERHRDMADRLMASGLGLAMGLLALLLALRTFMRRGREA